MMCLLCLFSNIEKVFDGEKSAAAADKAACMHCNEQSIFSGTNSDEGLYFVLYYLTEIFKKKEQISISRQQFKRAVKELNTYVSPVGIHAITSEYTWWMDPNDQASMIDAIDKMVGDYQFTCPVQEFAQRYAETFNDVYSYLFDHRASNHPWPSWTGVLHGDEIPFVFGEPLNVTYGYGEAERQLSREMMTYWANFAKTGYASQCVCHSVYRMLIYA